MLFLKKSNHSIMRLYSFCSVLLLFFSVTLFAQGTPPGDFENWTQWRGQFNTGVALAGDLPVEWNEGRNIKWKSEIPGVGHATPIIWGDQVILLTAVPTDQKVEAVETGEGQQGNQWMSPTTTDLIHKFVVLSVDRNSGKINWQTTVREELPYSSTHEFGSWASASPVTDGEHIYAYFGSHGLYCLDMGGKILWEHDFGRMEKVMSFGEGSSPVLYRDKLIVLRDHQGPSTLHLLNKFTGEVIWVVDRDEVSSWSTPLVVDFGGKTQIITSASSKVRSYNMENGALIWECSGLTGNVIPSPVYANGMVYVMSGFRGNALMAIDLSRASGDITGTDAIIFTYDQNTPYTPGPVLMDGRLYFLKANNGYLTCLDAADGTIYYSSQKLEGIQEIFTSPLGVKDRIYIAGTNGMVSVVRQGDEFRVLAQNQLDDSFFASPVAVGDDLFLRGKKYLYCVSAE
jgi:outer membrane protein assembly factor BamB